MELNNNIFPGIVLSGSLQFDVIKHGTHLIELNSAAFKHWNVLCLAYCLLAPLNSFFHIQQSKCKLLSFHYYNVDYYIMEIFLWFELSGGANFVGQTPYSKN